MPISFVFSVSVPASTPISATASAAVVAGAEALRDKALDQLTGDLQLGSDGDQVYVAGIAAIASDLKSNWLFVKGEWFLDTSKGVDYWGVVFAKGATLEAIEDEFRREALATKGVAAITLNITKRAGRVLEVEAVVTTNTGLVFNASLAVNAGS